MNRNSQAPSPFQSVIAGAAAGGVESLVTYPTEYIKTRKQLLKSSASSVRLLIDAVKGPGPGVLYTGSAAFCVSNASKSGVRFLTFDAVRDRLPKDSTTGKPTKVSNMLAGVVAGLAESITVVTPGENIKTKIVEDRAGARQYRSTAHAIQSIIRIGGVGGLFRGVVPVMMKQGSNALVRFTCYNSFLDTIQPFMQPADCGMLAPAVAGAMAGVVTVYATMPFDVVKTQMQRLATPGTQAQTGTLQCLVTIVRESGVAGLWRGTTPRLVRLSVSGALSFSIYQAVIEIVPKVEWHQDKGLNTL
ncbi:mitochondrial carrier domain-containing protein [Thelonectria olida]|uniref:Mitochondrial carrier domain-containing protein n=1 Tax=Thelonectria olida TaxID=1576542 RepID=A0A9P8VYB1_9HYPO|nr:mitochondrial carrier domain-containing protein [Thelonectria olida]